MKHLAFLFAFLASTPVLAYDLPDGLDASEIDLANRIIEAGQTEPISSELEAILVDRAIEIAQAIDDAKDISERGSGNLDKIEWPLDLRTPTETLVFSMPHVVEAFESSILDSIIASYSDAYQVVLTETQALEGERAEILNDLADNARVDLHRLGEIETHLGKGVAASRIIEAQIRWLIQMRGRIEFIQELHQ